MSPYTVNKTFAIIRKISNAVWKIIHQGWKYFYTTTAVGRELQDICQAFSRAVMVELSPL